MGQWDDAFRESKSEAVTEATWGHLAPKPRVSYRGEIIYAHGCYGDCIVISDWFKDPEGRVLSGSPWYHRHLMNFVNGATDKIDGGEVWKFTGTYFAFKNGSCRFTGSHHKVEI